MNLTEPCTDLSSRNHSGLEQSSNGNEEDDADGNRNLEYLDSKWYIYEEPNNELGLKYDN